jgi:hypothetical protein
MQTLVNVGLTPELLRKLTEAEGPCITVALTLGGQARTKLKEAMQRIEAEFRLRDSSLPHEVFQPFHDLAQIDDRDFAGGVVILSAPGVHYRFDSQTAIPETVEVGDAFNFRPLLTLLDRKADFYILALSQNHPRLIHCTESTSGEVGLPPSVPKNFLEFRETRQPDHTLDGRSAGGPSTGHMKGVLFGTSSDSDNKDEYHHDYYRAIDRGVTAMLNGTNAPLVVVAVEHELALFRSLSTYPHMVEPGVHGAPDGLKGGEMHKRALELLANYRPEAIRKQLDQFEKHAGTGHASSHAQEIVKAAYEGRVAHLFLQESAEYKGTFDDVRSRVKHHEDGITPARDLLNDAIVQTLKHGGEVTMLRAAEMPHGVPVCGILRYPSSDLQAEMAKQSAAQPV